MYCRKCGVSNPDEAQRCAACGEPLLPIQPSEQQISDIPNYLAWSIGCTVLCCQILGIVAVVYSVQVNTKLATGDHQGAARSSRRARSWCWAAFGTGLAYYLIYGGFTLFGFLAESAKH